MASRIEELSRDEIATRYGLSIKSVDLALRQAVDYCAEQANQTLKASGHRLPRSSPPRWRARAAAMVAAANGIIPSPARP